MPNFVTIDHVIKVATKHNCVVWYIYDESGELLDKRTSESAQLAVSMAELKESYSAVTGEYVEVRVLPKTPRKGGDQITNNFKFKVSCLQTGISSVTSKPSAELLPSFKGEASIYQLITDLRVQLAEEKKDRQIEELQRKLKEKESGNGRNRILEKLVTKILMPEIVGNNTVTTAAEPVADTNTEPVAGTKQPGQNKTAQATGKQDQQRLVKALQGLKEIDTDFITTLEKLQDFARKNPEAFENYKTML